VSLEQQRIEQLEKYVKELEEALWKHVEAVTAATNLIVELSKHRKPKGAIDLTEEEKKDMVWGKEQEDNIG
jgi:hypothetical protein